METLFVCNRCVEIFGCKKQGVFTLCSLCPIYLTNASTCVSLSFDESYRDGLCPECRSMEVLYEK